MMSRQPNTILGISIGTRKIGIAILKGTELIEWESHLFAGWWSEAKQNAILARYEKYIVQNAVTHIAIKVPPVIPLGSPLQLVLQKIQGLAGQYDCKTMLITKEDLKRRTHLRSMDSLLEYAVLQYPLLRREYIKEKQSKTHYHMKMFEAVLAAQQYMLTSTK